MQCVILAAGMATRLKSLTENTPKCLLEVMGKPIIFHMIEAIIKSDIKDFIIVIGFCGNQIVDYVKEQFPECSFTFVLNHYYAITNNAYSLHLARKKISKDFLLLDSDVVFDEEIIPLLLAAPHKPALAMLKNDYDEESMKVEIMDYDHQDEQQQQIVRIGKEITSTASAGESIGIEVFDLLSSQTLFSVLEKRLKEEGFTHEYYEASFQEMIEEGHPFFAVDIQDLKAIEIDTQEDLEKAEILF